MQLHCTSMFQEMHSCSSLQKVSVYSLVLYVERLFFDVENASHELLDDAPSTRLTCRHIDIERPIIASDEGVVQYAGLGFERV